MTTQLILNAVPAAIALAVTVSLIAWAIATQGRVGDVVGVA
jgi:hypothetical protein